MIYPMVSFEFPVDPNFSGIPITLYVPSMLTRPTLTRYPLQAILWCDDAVCFAC